jgi:hypothetical protein
MSKAEPNAPEGFRWLFLEIDVPVSRDFILLKEAHLGREMANDEASAYLMSEFSFSSSRAKQIVDTIKGEVV